MLVVGIWDRRSCINEPQKNFEIGYKNFGWDVKSLVRMLLELPVILVASGLDKKIQRGGLQGKKACFQTMEKR